MPTMDSLEDLLKDEIKDIYDAEKQLTKALPKLIKNGDRRRAEDRADGTPAGDRGAHRAGSNRCSS